VVKSDAWYPCGYVANGRDGWVAPEVKLREVASHETLKKIKLPKIDRSNVIFLTDIRGQAHYTKPYDLAIRQFDGRSS
jgi:hypothetical protein